MSLKEFDKAFGIPTSIEEEKKRFVNRIQTSLFNNIIESGFNSMQHNVFFKKVCIELGEDNKKYENTFGNYPSLRVFSKSDFIRTLRTVQAVYNCCSPSNSLGEKISDVVIKTIEMSSISLGIKWVDGVFYPIGDKLLDKELIDTALQLLNGYSDEKKDLKNALESYYAKSNYGVVENCYIAIEGLARKLLNNTCTLIDNKPKFLELLQFSPYWNKILANYLNYANEYRRHAGENRHDLKPNEVEAFLYLTCLMIRVALNKTTAS